MRSQSKPRTSSPRPKQLPLLAPKLLGRLEHGGDTREGLRKTGRPFSPDAAIHLVFKSHRAKGEWSMLHRRNRARIEQIVHTHARKSGGVKVYRFANVGNHLHLLVKAPNPEAFKRFLRTVTGLIARHVTKARKGSDAGGRFWAKTAFSRLVHWGREFKALCGYLGKNELEAVGFSGARLRITPKGEAVLVVGAPGFRPGIDDPDEWLNACARPGNPGVAST